MKYWYNLIYETHSRNIIKFTKSWLDNILKVAPRSQLINFFKICLRNKRSYIMINASNKGIYIEFWRKNNTTLVYLLSNCQQVLKIF